MFDPGKLSSLRRERGISQVALADKLGISPAQVHRLEKGQRRITIDMLIAYCEALDANIDRLFNIRTVVPIIGIINDTEQVLPLPPNTPYETHAPNLVPDPERLAALRWQPVEQLNVMRDHILFFYSDVSGIPDDAWGQRCFIRREDGTERIGWPIKEAGQIHVLDTTSNAEFNVKVDTAIPALAVVSPFLLKQLG